MNKIIIFFIFIILNPLTSYAHENFEHRCFKDDSGVCEYQVSIYQVIANPSFFHNKKIFILGHLYKETSPYNSLTIFPTKAEAELEIPLFLNGISIRVDKEGFEKISLGQRSFAGTFKVSKEPFPYYLGYLEIN